ncbi:Crp/Fnr family transcriptional regulator [Paraburkholderia tropica]|uniref:Crp/Fnr family transcriptional regulator n=1 Tax=Paraburkholderia tropica TaxID=92647 RepID=UPI002AB02E18|nr:Crp/Fnr family transcriptional regulator [Paraburkholderia tropica]
MSTHADPFTRMLDSEQGRLLLSKAVRRKLRRGQMLSMPSQFDNQIFIVRSGRIRVHLMNEQRELTLAFLEPGDVYSTHTPAWVTASESSEVLLIGARAFSELLVQMPAATGTVVRSLGMLLGRMIELVETLVFRDAHARLAHFLVSTARGRGQRSADGWTLRLHLSITEIALLLGSTRQTVSATLNHMHREGVIMRHGPRQFFIADLARLEAWNGERRPGCEAPRPKQSTQGVGQPTDDVEMPG